MSNWIWYFKLIFANFNSYQAKEADGEDKDKEEEIFIDLEDGDLEEEVKDKKEEVGKIETIGKIETSGKIEADDSKVDSKIMKDTLMTFCLMKYHARAKNFMIA